MIFVSALKNSLTDNIRYDVLNSFIPILFIMNKAYSIIIYSF